MSQLENLKLLIPEAPVAENALLELYLEMASDIICNLRNSDIVEVKYLTTQLKIAVEIYSKRGAEGQTSHSENGVNRTYEKADISASLLSQITPFVTTPFSMVRTII